jgi:hypothetical protein
VILATVVVLIAVHAVPGTLLDRLLVIQTAEIQGLDIDDGTRVVV